MTENIAAPLSAEDIAYWRGQVVGPRDVDPALPWTDSDVIALVARFLATLDAERLRAPAIDPRKALEAMWAANTNETGTAYETRPLPIPEPLDEDEFRDVHEQAMREHILDPQKGWPHTRGGPTPGDGPQPVDGCDDLCSDDIVDRLRRLEVAGSR